MNYLKWSPYQMHLENYLLMREIMRIINVLRQTLQQQYQDKVNIMRLVCSTKGLIQNLRENGWDKLLKNVASFCEKHDI